MLVAAILLLNVLIGALIAVRCIGALLDMQDFPER